MSIHDKTKKHLPREEVRQVLIMKTDEEEEMSVFQHSGLKEEEGDSPEVSHKFYKIIQ